MYIWSFRISVYMRACHHFADVVCRVVSNLSQEVRNLFFARTDQSFVRELNKAFFQHLHDLDMAFHKQRSIGAINQAINRGTR